MRGGPVIERRHSRGSSTTIGDSTITPVAKSLVIRWPGRGSVWSSGSVWSGPAAVIVEREGHAERIPIVNLNGWMLRAMRVGTLALIAAWIVLDRKGRDSK